MKILGENRSKKLTCTVEHGKSFRIVWIPPRPMCIVKQRRNLDIRLAYRIDLRDGREREREDIPKDTRYFRCSNETYEPLFLQTRTKLAMRVKERRKIQQQQ